MSGIAFIVKSTVRNKTKFYEDLELLKSLQLIENLKVFETAHKKHAIQLASDAALNHFTKIIAVGGDGSLNEVVNGIMNVADQLDELPCVGILPYGSANDFAKSAGVKNDILEFAKLIEHDKFKPIDLGLCEFVDQDGDTKKRYFINILEAGIGAMVVRKVNASNKTLGVKIAFLKAITESFLTYTPTQVFCKTDLETIEEKVLTIAVCNGSFLGNGMCISPDAKIDDGSFGLTCIYDISMKDYAFNLRKLFKKEKIDHPKIYYSKAKSIEISPNKFSLAIEGDGEFFGYAPTTIQMLHHQINFMMP